MRAVLLALMLAACGNVEGLPEGGQPLTPPLSYSRWYELAERCSGKTGDFARVRWFWYESATIPGRMQAATWPKSHLIAIAQPYISDSAIVMHEALHDVLGIDGHPAEFFGTPPYYADGKCGSLIAH